MMHTGDGYSAASPRLPVKRTSFEQALTPGPVAVWQSASVVQALPVVPSYCWPLSPPSSPVAPLLLPLPPLPLPSFFEPSVPPPSCAVAVDLLLEQPLPANVTTPTSAPEATIPINFFHAMTCLLQLEQGSLDTQRNASFPMGLVH